MKAIHNSRTRLLANNVTVLNTSKIQNESNSQRLSILISLQSYCAQYVKDTKWKQFTTSCSGWYNCCLLCSIRQRYKMKAIHNKKSAPINIFQTVLNTSKIQNESNSQQIIKTRKIQINCAQYVKDTKWKQFITIMELELMVKTIFCFFCK